MSGHPRDITNQRFGRLVAIRPDFKDKYNQWHWLCRCDCGNEKAVALGSLTRGLTRSCGCLDKEAHLLRPNRTTHGMCGTRLHRIWKAMKTRCNNPNTDDYKAYGAKGIRVCDEWKNDFMVFHDWAISNGYSDKLSIDRIDVHGDYCPENCRWANNETQANNKADTCHVDYNGKTYTLTELSQMTGFKRKTLYYRIFIAEWDVEKALSKGLKGGKANA